MSLQLTRRALAAPKVFAERRNDKKRRGSGSIRPGAPDLPKSAGGFIFMKLRPHLPAHWQYGWRWKLLQGLWVGGGGSCVAYLAYVMFWRDSDEMIAAKAEQYTFVRDERGQVVDIGYKPLIDAAKRAKRRADRLLAQPDDEYE